MDYRGKFVGRYLVLYLLNGEVDDDVFHLY